MTDKTINEALKLYQEAGRFFKENRQLSREARRAIREADGELTKAMQRSWTEKAARNAVEIRRLLRKIIALGENNEALRRHNVYALAHRNLGLFASGGFKSYHGPFPTYMEDSLTHLNAAISLGVAKDRKVVRRLGAAYYQAGKYNEAIEPLKECIEFDPRDDVARYQLCLTYVALHDKTGAREQFEALKQNSSSPNAHLVKMLAPVMERPMEKVDEAETSELTRLIENFRRIKG